MSVFGIGSCSCNISLGAFEVDEEPTILAYAVNLEYLHSCSSSESGNTTATVQGFLCSSCLYRIQESSYAELLVWYSKETIIKLGLSSTFFSFFQLLLAVF